MNLSTNLTGQHIVGGSRRGRGGPSEFRAVDPTLGAPVGPTYSEPDAGDIADACLAAHESFDAFRATSPESRAALLECIADEVEALGDSLVRLVESETGLARERVAWERHRTLTQAREFAQRVREGDWVDPRIDRPDRTRQPLPRPDLRRALMPLGPVVIFGASNFPLAISVVGTDLMTAFGVGCPVVVKAHPAHPGTCELLGAAVLRAIERCGLDVGIFSLLFAREHATSLALVRRPEISAVAFTGSELGGRAIFDAVASRPSPIPVFAEMGSLNPVFVLPGALREKGDALAAAWLASITRGAGQFCTCPSLLVAIDGDDLRSFESSAVEALRAAAPATMLHGGIRESYEGFCEHLARSDDIEVLGRSALDADRARNEAAPCIFACTVEAAAENPEFVSENFGPSAVVVRARSMEELEAFAESLRGQLSATIHAAATELGHVTRLQTILERKAGRVLFAGFPTGVEIGHATHHGGPYPASTDSRHTSIGMAALQRFVRPVCYQDAPDELLPPELRDANPRKIRRLVDGEWTRASIESSD